MKIGRCAAQGGYTYFGLLLAVLAASLAVSAGATLLGNDMRRDKESELLFAGDEIRRAIELYHAKNTAGPQPFPRTMDALLRDPNQLSIQRYLRKIYRDPLHEPEAPGASPENGSWVLIRDANGQIVGVHSNSQREPLRKTGFPKQYEGFRQTKRYADWQFLAAGGVPVDPKAGAVAEPKNFIPAPVVPAMSPPPPPPPPPPPAPVEPVAAPAAVPVPAPAAPLEPAAAAPAPPPVPLPAAVPVPAPA
ncbi:MAG: hypothetical protein WCR74_17835, partial [Betaproteobacteria bacterium]